MPETGRNSRPLLVVFARKPDPGKTKTRLAEGVGEERAAIIYKRMAETVWRESRSPAYDRWVSFTPAEKGAFFQRWLPGAERYLPQPSTDLGESLGHVFLQGFQGGSPAVAVVGTDIPGLRSRHVERAFAILARREAVLGPCPDGGFWLIGLTLFLPGLFDGVAWSTSRAAECVAANFRRRRVRLGFADTLRDVDTAEDLALLSGSARAGEKNGG